jgi:hypothetical protein
MENDRRDFFKTVGAATAAAMMAAPRAAEAVATTEKYVPAYRHVITVDGSPLDEVISFDGGEARGTVAKDAAVNGLVRKHISNIFYSDMTVTVGAGLSNAFYVWIQGMFNRAYTLRNGSLLSADAQGNPRGEIDFYSALITKVVFPALDSLHRAPAAIAVTFSPEQIRTLQPSIITRFGGAKQKAWQCSNFRLQIAGLEEASTHVTKVDAFTVKQPIAADQIGIFREPTKSLTPLDVSDLVFYCPEEFAGPFRAWAYDALVNGHHLAADEKTGTLEFLAPDKKTVYFTLTFGGLGIYGCGLEGDDMKTPINRNVKVELYCETVSLTVGQLNG